MKTLTKSTALIMASFLILLLSSPVLADSIMIEMVDGELLKVPVEEIKEIYLTSDRGERISGVLPPETFLKESVRDYYESCSWFLRGNSFATSGNMVRVHDVTVTGVMVGTSKVTVMIEAEVIGRNGFPSSRALGTRFTYGSELIFEQGADGWRLATPPPRGDIPCDISAARRY